MPKFEYISRINTRSYFRTFSFFFPVICIFPFLVLPYIIRENKTVPILHIEIYSGAKKKRIEIYEYVYVCIFVCMCMVQQVIVIYDVCSQNFPYVSVYICYICFKLRRRVALSNFFKKKEKFYARVNADLLCNKWTLQTLRSDPFCTH